MALIRQIGFTRFTRWGVNLGRLNVTAAKHIDGLDGTDELRITCTDDVNKGDYIVWFDWLGMPHEHIIDEPKRTHNENGTLQTEFTAVNSIAELWDDWNDDLRPSNVGVSTALTRVLSGTRWSVGTCTQDGSASAVFYHQSTRESIAQAIETWGGEMQTSIATDGVKVTKRTVSVVAQRGDQQSPKRFTWTKDIKTISREVASDNPKTRIYGFGKGVETDSGGYGRRLTFASINNGKSYVEDAQASKLWGHPSATGGVLPASGVYVNEQCEDAAQLLKETQACLDASKEPKVSYTANVLDLYAFGRDWEGVGVGDKVAIIDKGFNDDGIRLTGRVSQIERNLLTGDAKVTFGNLSDSMADMWQSVSSTLRGNQLAAAEYDAVAGTSVSWLTRLQGALNDQFRAVGTYKVETFELGSIYSNVPIDATTGKPLSTTSNMWAVNINGRGIRLASALKSNGDWNWRTFITGASVTADCINAGTMTANRVRAGLLTDQKGYNTWDLTNGTLSTNYMRANNADISGNFSCGYTSNLLKLVSGQIQGLENGTRIGFIDFSAHFRNVQTGELYNGLQLQGQRDIRISSPQISVSDSADTSVIATICKTGTMSQPIVTEVHDAGNGTVGWHYGTFTIAFLNGLCTSYGTCGTG